jgi:hypothetical protein
MEVLLVAQKTGQHSIFSPETLQDNRIFFIPYYLKKDIIQLFPIIGLFIIPHLH